ncbi:MAG: polysaccharide deacetylase family protein [Clostridia bacterium]|nr:polysaccharide deacetylase family protein [Clostridia bacterium]
MKIINKRITIITNAILFLVMIAVFSIGFLPQSVAPMYGGNEIGAIYNGNRENRNVSLMFNVYENTKVVNGILDVLSEKGAKATFFVGGCWADDNEQTLKRIVAEGHEIANHGYFHKDHAKLDVKQNEQEISLADTVIYALSGVKPTLFAPPSGSFSVATLEVAFNLGYKVIMWSKDTIDWRDSNHQTLITRATKNATNGDLILMHPKAHTLSVLPQIIDFYKQNGFNLVTVSENVGEIGE